MCCILAALLLHVMECLFSSNMTNLHCDDITSKNDTALERIRVIIRRDLSKFNGQDDNATIQRCLIILYLANIHPLFKDLDAKMYDNNPLLYFSGPKLEKVKREISKECGTSIKFDRYRTARSKYEMCKSRGYVDIKKEVGNNWFFALTEKGLERVKK